VTVCNKEFAFTELNKNKGLFISSCIDRFRHVAFHARQILFSTLLIQLGDRELASGD
jgi:hypothetical protein